LWWCKGFNGRGEPAPAYEHGLLYIVNGLAGDIYSVKPGGEGDVTADHRVWHTPRRAGRDLPSPVAIGKYLLVMSMAGIITCYDCQSGAELWKDRLPDKYASTPLVSEGKAYITSDAGETSVVEPGDRLNVVATSKIVPADGEVFRAALVPCQGQIFIRSTRNLYCIGAKGAARK
jgi:outer membrane protein assembly factor BamB